VAQAQSGIASIMKGAVRRAENQGAVVGGGQSIGRTLVVEGFSKFFFLINLALELVLEWLHIPVALCDS